MKKITINQTNEILYYEKLNNGLEVYIIPNKNQKNFYITYNTKFGSINTEFKTSTDKSFKKVPNGIAHYLEHLMFNMENGTAFDFYSKLGSSINAFTTYNLTCYEVYSSTYFKENLNYLLEYVETPYFTNELVNNERGIITEEIKMYDNNPNTELTYSSYKNIFINDKRKNLISGTVEDIKKITKENLLDCYNTFYNPNNMFIVITGNVNPEEAIAIIEKRENERPIKNINIIKKEITEPKKVNKKYEEIKMNVETNKVNISYKIPRKQFNKLNVTPIDLNIYISIIFNLLFGSTSIIQEKLISSKIIQNGININKTFTKDSIIVSLTTETDYVDTFIKLVKETLDNIKIDSCDLDRKLKVYKSNYILHFDEIELVNNNIQDNIIEYNKFINDYMDIYDNINIDILNKIIDTLKTKEESILVIKPK